MERWLRIEFTLTGEIDGPVSEDFEHADLNTLASQFCSDLKSLVLNEVPEGAKLNVSATATMHDVNPNEGTASDGPQE